MPKWKAGDLELSLPAHLVAIATCLGLLTLVPIALYGFLVLAGLVLFGDPGGWFNFLLVPLISFAFALLSTGLLSPLSMLLQLLRDQWRFPAWLPLVAAYPVAFALISCTMIANRARIHDPSELIPVALASLIIAACFWAYWAPLMASGAIFEFLRRRQARRL